MDCERCHRITRYAPFCAECARATLSVRVGPSSVHGLGLFALREFEAGDLVAPYTGQIMNPSVAARLYPDGDDYLLAGPDDAFYVCARLPRGCLGLGGLVNCDPLPNAELVPVDLADQLAKPCLTPVWVRALSTIRDGEEILVDYGPRHIV